MGAVGRREFIKLGSAVGAASLVAPRIAFTQNAANSDTLVVIFLRGALDGLNAVIPYTESAYYSRRSTIAIPTPGSANGAIDLDGQFGLHPSLAPLKAHWDRGELAIVQAAGLITPSRSHFDAQDFMERAWMAQGTVTTGWLNRYLLSSGTLDESNFRALAMGKVVQRSLLGPAPVIGLDSIESFGLVSRSTRVAAEAGALQAMFDDSSFIDIAAGQAFNAVATVAASGAANLAVENGASYVADSLGTQLTDLARLIKSDMGVQVAALDVNGWDHHDSENNRLPPLLDSLARNLSAFVTDLGSAMSKVTVLTMTEFGRRAYQNASGGTDHGRGSVMFALGGNVLGRQVYGDWPGLGDAQLDNGDLAVTTDYRSVLAEVLSRRMGNSDYATVFPGWSGAPTAGLFVAR
jgi:uncharacterized protein (DUF1501 family)